MPAHALMHLRDGAVGHPVVLNAAKNQAGNALIEAIGENLPGSFIALRTIEGGRPSNEPRKAVFLELFK